MTNKTLDQRIREARRKYVKKSMEKWGRKYTNEFIGRNRKYLKKHLNYGGSQKLDSRDIADILEKEGGAEGMVFIKGGHAYVISKIVKEDVLLYDPFKGATMIKPLNFLKDGPISIYGKKLVNNAEKELGVDDLVYPVKSKIKNVTFYNTRWVKIAKKDKYFKKLIDFIGKYNPLKIKVKTTKQSDDVNCTLFASLYIIGNQPE